MVVAGFPCQPFSVAGLREGFNDDRSNAFFELVRIINGMEIKPRVLFLENVKHLVSHDKGNTFQVIEKTLNSMGYKIKYQVLNAKDYGNVPQNRERIYIVGFINDSDYEQFKFPEPILLSKTVTDLLDDEVSDKYHYTSSSSIYDLLTGYDMKEGIVYQCRRRYIRENKSGVIPTLTANMGGGGHNVPIIIRHGIYRKLTPRECFRAQGFPETYVLPNKMSDTQLYKQIGNSVAVPVIKRIADNILSIIKKSPSDMYSLNDHSNIS